MIQDHAWASLFSERPAGPLTRLPGERGGTHQTVPHARPTCGLTAARGVGQRLRQGGVTSLLAQASLERGVSALVIAPATIARASGDQATIQRVV